MRRALAAVEVALAAVAVLADLFLPSLVLVAMAAVSLLVRGDRPVTLGLRRLSRPRRDVAEVLALTVGWTVLQLALFMPVVEHLTGETQDVTQFEDLQGNVPMLLLLLLLSWTLAAVGEELAFRGYLFARAREALGPGRAALAGAVVISAVLFGLIHTEQGAVGVVLATIDGVFYAWLRIRYDSLWASVLSHGTTNTIGMVAYFLVGPVAALW